MWEWASNWQEKVDVYFSKNVYSSTTSKLVPNEVSGENLSRTLCLICHTVVKIRCSARLSRYVEVFIHANKSWHLNSNQISEKVVNLQKKPVRTFESKELLRDPMNQDSKPSNTKRKETFFQLYLTQRSKLRVLAFCAIWWKRRAFAFFARGNSSLSAPKIEVHRYNAGYRMHWISNDQGMRIKVVTGPDHIVHPKRFRKERRED